MGIFFHTMAPNSLSHAEHNEKTSEYLSKENGYDDWVITTCFYSAMHYMHHKLFPMTVSKDGEDLVLNSFLEYCAFHKRYGQKHKLMRSLIEENCPTDISTVYNQLLDISWTARYSNYQFSKKISKLTQRRLVAIRSYCTR